MSFDAAALANLRIEAASCSLDNQLSCLCRSEKDNSHTIESKLVQLAREAQGVLACEIAICNTLLFSNLHEIPPILYSLARDRILDVQAKASIIYKATFDSEDRRKRLAGQLREREKTSIDDLLSIMKQVPSKSDSQV